MHDGLQAEVKKCGTRLKRRSCVTLEPKRIKSPVEHALLLDWSLSHGTVLIIWCAC